jgi:Mg-chelatase subunit ChlD
MARTLRKTVVRAFSSSPDEEITELTGKLGLTEIGRGLMHSVIEQKEKSDDGKLIQEAVNQGFGGFVPDAIYENLVQNYKNAERLYGKTFLNLVTGHDSDYLGRNVKIPEFQRELKKRIAEKINQLHEDGLVENNIFTEKGMQLAALVTYIEELESVTARGIFGEEITKQKAAYGSKGDTHTFHKGDRYRDIALRKSIKKASRRQHKELHMKDLDAHERESHGSISIIYGIDASGSMKGQKIDIAKKAGIALAFKAIERKDNVGTIVFSKDVKTSVAPTKDFGLLLRTISSIRAARETDITKLLEKATELFPRTDTTKHLIILSDALPTVGEKPEQDTIEAASIAFSHGITISVVGINLDEKGEKLAQKIAEVGNGRFYLVKNIAELDRIVLEDYYAVSTD